MCHLDPRVTVVTKDVRGSTKFSTRTWSCRGPKFRDGPRFRFFTVSWLSSKQIALELDIYQNGPRIKIKVTLSFPWHVHSIRKGNQ